MGGAGGAGTCANTYRPAVRIARRKKRRNIGFAPFVSHWRPGMQVTSVAGRLTSLWRCERTFHKLGFVALHLFQLVDR